MMSAVSRAVMGNVVVVIVPTSATDVVVGAGFILTGMCRYRILLMGGFTTTTTARGIKRISET
jgi:hypothetical protein